jgi:hypothetical protein
MAMAIKTRMKQIQNATAILRMSTKSPSPLSKLLVVDILVTDGVS